MWRFVDHADAFAVGDCRLLHLVLHARRTARGRPAVRAEARSSGVATAPTTPCDRSHRCTFLEGYPPGRVLELGAADGRRLALFRSLGWDAVGLDIDPQSAARARRERGIEVHVGALEPNTFAEGTFDAVVSNHVLEHLPDPVSTLMVAAALLRPGGRLIAVTPNGRSYGQRRFGKDWYGLDAPRHLVIFTVPGLRAAARAAGFQRATVTSTACRAEQVLTRSAEAQLGLAIFREDCGRPSRVGRSVAPAGSLARPSP